MKNRKKFVTSSSRFFFIFDIFDVVLGTIIIFYDFFLKNFIS